MPRIKFRQFLSTYNATEDCALRNRSNSPSLITNALQSKQLRTEGGGREGWGVQTPLEIPRALQNLAKLSPIVKTVKNC